MPTLFGIGRTAPSFHDNSAASLEEVIRHYQALFELLTFFANGNLFAKPVTNRPGLQRRRAGLRPLPVRRSRLLAYLRRQ